MIRSARMLGPRKRRLLFSLVASTLVHALLLCYALPTGGRASAERLPQMLVVEIRVAAAIPMNVRETPPPTPSDPASGSAPPVPVEHRPPAAGKNSNSGPPGFAVEPDLSALETLGQILPARLVLRLHVSRNGTLESVEVREKQRVSREFLELAKKLIAATPLYPARSPVGPTEGVFDVAIQTQALSPALEPSSETRPAPTAEEN